MSPSDAAVIVEARAPGRVNLIGDHTDYTGGLALPIAIDRHTVVRGASNDSPLLTLHSDQDPNPAEVPLPVGNVLDADPGWPRLVAALAHLLQLRRGFAGTVTSTIPIGAGLSSSAALEVSLALAFDQDGPRSPLAMARLCQEAEHLATGAPTGIMDQLVSLAGVAGHGLLLDCAVGEYEPIPLPPEAEIVVRFVAERRVADSAYADRVRACALAEAEIGPLRLADEQSVAALSDPILRSRARHVVTENRRVRDFAVALGAGDLGAAGRLMTESHASLRDDYQVSTPQLDRAVSAFLGTPGVFGARLTGAGFGGCVVALTKPGAVDDALVVQAVDGATVIHSG